MIEPKIHPVTKKRLQRVFDRGVSRVLKQGKKSYDSHRQICMYRGPKSRCCVIGHTIDDEHYDPSFEGFSPVAGSWASDAEKATCPKILRAIAESNEFKITTEIQKILFSDLLTELQRVHDTFPASRWRGRFRRVAKMFGLSDSATYK